MDASDEERLRQLMLGSDSDEDELDATSAVPAAPAPAQSAPPALGWTRMLNVRV